MTLDELQRRWPGVTFSIGRTYTDSDRWVVGVDFAADGREWRQLINDFTGTPAESCEYAHRWLTLLHACLVVPPEPWSDWEI